MPIILYRDKRVFFLNETTGYLSNRLTVPGNLTQVLLTQDSGQNWDDVAGSSMELGTGVASLSGHGTGFLAHAIGSSIYTTTDNGQSWTASSFPNGYAPMDICFFNDQIGAAALWDGTFQYGGNVAWTSNGGQSWQQFPWNGTFNKVISVQNFSESGIVALSEGMLSNNVDPKLYRTVDGGLNWDTIPLTFPTNVGHKGVDIISRNSSIWYLLSLNDLTGEGHIYRTSDGGDNWTLDQISPIVLNCLCQSPSSAVFALGSESAAFRKNDFVTSGDVKTTKDLIFYPNPAHNLVKINGVASRLSVSNSLGFIVYDFKGPIDRIDVSNWPTGVYHVQYENDQEIVQSLRLSISH